VIAVAGCAAESSGEKTESNVGSSVVASHEDGSTIVSSVSSDKVDDSLTITFNRDARSAKLTPKFGQARTLQLDTVPTNVAEADRYVGDALARGTNAAQGKSAAAGVTPKTFEPPPADCLHTCYGVCDDAFPNACQNAVCRFGCYVGCTSK
jgi:hypothetical protein